MKAPSAALAAFFLLCELLVIATHWQESKQIFVTVYRTLWKYAPPIDNARGY